MGKANGMKITVGNKTAIICVWTCPCPDVFIFNYLGYGYDYGYEFLRRITVVLQLLAV